MPTPPLKPTLPATNGHAAPPRNRVDWEARRVSRQAAYDKILLRGRGGPLEVRGEGAGPWRAEPGARTSCCESSPSSRPTSR